MQQRRRVTGWLRWAVLLTMGGSGIALALGTEIEGRGAIAAEAPALSSWRFNPDNSQLEILLPNGTTPRYFLLAQPARIVLDLPNTEVGSTSGEQTYGGAVRRVRVAQFEPGMTRIVLELNPDAVLAPGQVELTQGETLASGGTRWTLRPLLATGFANTPTDPEPIALATPAPAPAVVPSDVSPEPMLFPTQEPPLHQAPEPVAAPVEPASITVPPPIPDLTETDPMAVPLEEPLEEPDGWLADGGDASPVAPPVMDLTGPVPVLIPGEQTDGLLADETDGFPIPPDAIAITVPDPQPLPLSQTAPSIPGMAPPTPPNSPLAAGDLPPLAGESPILVDHGAEFLVTEPRSNPPFPSSSETTPTTGVSPETDDSLAAAMFPEGLDSPLDFPVPTLPTSEAIPTVPTTPPMALPAALPDSTAPAIAVPPPHATASEPDPLAIAAAPTDPTLLIPSGTTLQLRYPRTSALELDSRSSWQEVLVLVNPVQDSAGNVLIPAGSQIIGRFEPQGRGHRFVAQGIALDQTVLLLQGRSAALDPRDGIEPNQVIQLEVTGDLRRSP